MKFRATIEKKSMVAFILIKHTPYYLFFQFNY